MKREFFLRALSGIEDDLLIEANVEKDGNKAIAENKPLILPIRIAGTAAACLILLVGVWAFLQSGFAKSAMDNAAPEAEIFDAQSPMEDAVIGGAAADGGHGADNKAESAGSTADTELHVKIVVNDWLLDMGSTVQCSMVTLEKTKSGQIVSLTLTGDPGADAVSNLVLAVCGVTQAELVQILLPDGTVVTVPGNANS